MRELIPVLDKNGRIRVNATPLDREALPMVLEYFTREGYRFEVIPVDGALYGYANKG